MNYFDLVQQFPSKERRVQDIIRYLSTRVDDNSNYSLLLGAGCSITSGIRSATELIRLWRREILLIRPIEVVNPVHGTAYFAGAHPCGLLQRQRYPHGQQQHGPFKLHRA
jgi:hypothetical protein